MRYVGELEKTTYKPLCIWAEKLGFAEGRMKRVLSKHKMINLAYNLRGHYDLGVGIATGGLEPAYFFSLFALEVMVCECHEGRDFRWAGEPSREHLTEMIAGKRVVVIDEDIAYGKNSGRAVNEILKYRPQQADLALVWTPWKGTSSVDTYVENASPKFGRVVTAAEFGYNEFDKAVEIVERALRARL